MSRRARSFVVIMIIIALSSLLLRYGAEKLIKVTMAQNESQAQTNLKFISTALENYAKDHLGAYPTELSLLSESNPPYLSKDYLNQPFLKGYDYSCSRLEASGYSCSAVPISCGLTGTLAYTISIEGLFISEDCSKKE